MVQLSSMFCGVTLADDIKLISEFSENNSFIIGGSDPLKTIFAHLLSIALPQAEIIIADKKTVDDCTVFGAYNIIK